VPGRYLAELAKRAVEERAALPGDCVHNSAKYVPGTHKLRHLARRGVDARSPPAAPHDIDAAVTAGARSVLVVPLSCVCQVLQNGVMGTSDRRGCGNGGTSAARSAVFHSPFVVMPRRPGGVHLLLVLPQVVHVDVAGSSIQFSCISTARARTSRRQLAAFGKIRTTRVRRLISSFCRSSILVDFMCLWWLSGRR